MPSGATTTLTPSTWTQLSDTSWSLPATTTLAAVTVNVQLPASSARLEHNNAHGMKVLPVLWGVLLLPFIGKLRRVGKRLGRTLSILLLAGASMAAIAGLSGCGSTSGFFGRQVKTYTISETVTSGSLSRSTSFTLTVE
jgi:hypothetical protein